MKLRVAVIVFVSACALFAVDAFVLPPVTPELKKEAQDYYNNECKGCNVESYAEKPEDMVRYLMHPTPQHPDEWPAMEITPLTEEQAKMMTAWLLYILRNPDDPGRPK